MLGTKHVVWPTLLPDVDKYTWKVFRDIHVHINGERAH